MSAHAPDRRPAVRLVMVTGENNNKVYEMAENGDGTFTARFGRIGARLQERTYDASRWDATYRAKTRKGYVDITALAAEEGDGGFAIEDPAVAALVDRLRAAADAALSAQYLVAPDAVSARQVTEAQTHLDALADLAGRLTGPPADQPDLVAAFDAHLLDLYRTIPRVMGNVREHLLGQALDPENLADVLDAEQEALDRMAQRVRLGDGEAARPTLLDALGVDLQRVTDEAVLARVRSMMGAHADRLQSVVKVVHPAQRARFETHVAAARRKTTRLLWHGSRSENWLSILETGLVLNPARAVITGKMFGHGLYFASDFQKSLGYTSLRGAFWTGQSASRGVLALYDVHVGSPLVVRKHEAWCYELTADRLGQHRLFGTPDSLHARAGTMLRHDEIVVYREAQACPRYLVEVAAD
ncbi:MAG: ADP-ribose polymerase [Rhodothermaceae bacterium]|nr:ADP-ribose polymerase [Rhodothermaceae bacterium]MBC14273.1 ADP-ribose polymerase [Rhodothermaceae bacterium]